MHDDLLAEMGRLCQDGHVDDVIWVVRIYLGGVWVRLLDHLQLVLINLCFGEAISYDPLWLYHDAFKTTKPQNEFVHQLELIMCCGDLCFQVQFLAGQALGERGSKFFSARVAHSMV